MHHRDGYFLASVYKDVTFCLSHYGQLPSHLFFYQFHECNLLHSLARNMQYNRLHRVGGRDGRDGSRTAAIAKMECFVIIVSSPRFASGWDFLTGSLMFLNLVSSLVPV